MWISIDKELQERSGINYRIRYRRLKWVAGFLLLFSVAAASFIGNHYLSGSKSAGFVDLKKPIEQSTSAGTNNGNREVRRSEEEQNRKHTDEFVKSESNVLPPDIINPERKITAFKQPVSAKNSNLRTLSGDYRIESTPTSTQSAGKQLISSTISSAEGAKTRLITEPVDLLANTAVGLQRRLKAGTSVRIPAISGAAGIDKPEGLSISLYGGANFSANRFRDEDNAPGQGRRHHEPDGDEAYPVSFSTGLAVQYPLSSTLYLRSGISYTDTKIAIGPHKVFARDDRQGRVHYELNSSAGSSALYTKTGSAMPGDSAYAFSSEMHSRYLRVPLGLAYRIPAGRFSIWPSAGAGLNILLSGNSNANLLSSQNIEQKLSGTIQGLRSSYVDAQIGLGLDYPISNRVAVELRPTARFAVNTVNTGSAIQTFRNFFSVESGLKYQF